MRHGPPSDVITFKFIIEFQINKRPSRQYGVLKIIIVCSSHKESMMCTSHTRAYDESRAQEVA